MPLRTIRRVVRGGTGAPGTAEARCSRKSLVAASIRARWNSMRFMRDLNCILPRLWLGFVGGECPGPSGFRSGTVDLLAIAREPWSEDLLLCLSVTRHDYDRSGNLSRRSDGVQGEDEYRYDAVGRLLQHIDPKGKVERYFTDPAGDRLRTEVKQVQARKVVGGDDDGVATWTREGIYQGVHYVFDRAGDLVRKGAPQGEPQEDLTLIWDANHRLAESRRNGESTCYGYDPLGRRVFKRNPTQTTWFFWDGDALLGEVQQANDAEEAAPVWVGNVASLVETRRRQRRLERIDGNASSVVIPKTVGNVFKGNIEIQSTEFERMSREIGSIYRGAGTNKQKSDRAWALLEGACRS